MNASEMNEKAYAENNIPAGCMIDNAVANARGLHYEEGSPEFEDYVVADIRSQLSWIPAPEAVSFFADLGIAA